MNPLEAIHEQHRQAQKHAHENTQSNQAKQHAQQQMDLKNLHGRHQQELKQLHQKHALHHDQVTQNYGAMPPAHIDAVANMVGTAQAQEQNDMLARHSNEETNLHNAHFHESLRDHLMRNAQG